MIYEFGWNADDYDLMSAGTVAGHILECGGQSTGGNFLGDWESIEIWLILVFLLPKLIQMEK